MQPLLSSSWDAFAMCCRRPLVRRPPRARRVSMRSLPRPQALPWLCSSLPRRPSIWSLEGQGLHALKTNHLPRFCLRRAARECQQPSRQRRRPPRTPRRPLGQTDWAPAVTPRWPLPWRQTPRGPARRLKRRPPAQVPTSTSMTSSVRSCCRTTSHNKQMLRCASCPQRLR